MKTLKKLIISSLIGVGITAAVTYIGTISTYMRNSDIHFNVLLDPAIKTALFLIATLIPFIALSIRGMIRERVKPPVNDISCYKTTIMEPNSAVDNDIIRLAKANNIKVRVIR